MADDLVGRLLRDDAELGLDLGQGGLDVEVVLGPVLVGPDRAHLVGAEDALEDVGVDDGGRHGGSPILRNEPSQWAARVRVRRAARTTGRSIMRPSSWAAPGEAASASSTRRARSTACVVGKSAVWIAATWAGWMHSFAPKPCRRDHARSASRRASSPSSGRDPADRGGDTGASRRHGQPTGGVGQPVGGVIQFEVEVERVVQGAEDEPDDPGSCGDLLDRFDAAGTFHQCEDGDTRRGGKHGRDVVGRLGLGQHHRGQSRGRLTAARSAAA